MRTQVDPTYTINFTDQVYDVQICNSPFAYDLICVAVAKKLILGVLRFPEETEDEVFKWDRIKDLYHDSRCHALTFSPNTSLVVIPKVVNFCAAGADFNLRIFRTDLDKDDTVQVLKGHTNYVNGIAWDSREEFLASVSDDHSCKIWSSEHNYKVITTFCLSSAGMSVCWHPEENGKILVAEKNGVIHMYNVRSQQAILSLESPKFPLMSMDWNLHNRFYVTALAGGEVVTWDLRKICGPIDIKQVHEDGGRIVRFSPHSDVIYASIGRPDITLKIYSLKSTVPLIETSLKLYGGMSWHYHLSYVAAACDRKLYFWRVQVK